MMEIDYKYTGLNYMPHRPWMDAHAYLAYMMQHIIHSAIQIGCTAARMSAPNSQCLYASAELTTMVSSVVTFVSCTILPWQYPIALSHTSLPYYFVNPPNIYIVKCVFIHRDSNFNWSRETYGNTCNDLVTISLATTSQQLPSYYPQAWEDQFLYTVPYNVIYTYTE